VENQIIPVLGMARSIAESAGSLGMALLKALVADLAIGPGRWNAYLLRPLFHLVARTALGRADSP